MAWLVIWILAAGFAHPSKAEESRASRFQHGALMILGFYFIFHDASRAFIYGKFYHVDWVRWFGDFLTGIGLAFSLWARFHLGRYWSGVITLKQGHKLITTGPYQIVRHPIYTGMIAAVIGSALAAETADGFLGLALFVWACLIKVQREEALLTTEFGAEYAQFRRTVPMLVPWLFHSPQTDG